jgi:two-component system, NarL family, nitrate/nitrite response regulator NarL
MRILVADDHDLVREMVSAYLQGEGLGTITPAGDLPEALAKVAALGPFDLVLLDYDMPGMAGLQGLRAMLAANGGKPVALISGAVTAEVAEQALELGAAGFVPKTMGTRSLVAAVRLMAAGENFAPLSLIRRPKAPEEGLLSPRETDVLRGVAAGKSNKEIARDLDLQEVTVKLHVKTMSRKLGAKNRTHAAMIARDRKLV